MHTRFKRLGRLALVPAIVPALLLALAGCAPVYNPGPQAYQGGAMGAAVGATAGALIDGRNRWRGAVIGGALGAVLGGTLGEISDRAAREAAASQQGVVYQNLNGPYRVAAYPGQSYPGYHPGRPAGHGPGYNQGACRYVRQEVWQDGRLVDQTRRLVCY